MSSNKYKKSGLAAVAFGLALTGATAQSFAQNNDNTSSTATQQTTTASQDTTKSNSTKTTATAAASGQKMKIKGIITSREADTFTVQDESGTSTTVRLSDKTSVKTNGGFLRSGKNYGTTQLLRGLNVEVEGRGDGSGQLEAQKIRFSDTDLKVARSLQSRVDPVETRVGTAENRISQSEQNAQRLSGQIDELAAVSNAARGGAKAAQDTADQAVAGVNSTNERISALDDYDAKQVGTINFKVGSAVLQPEAKTKLDELAKQALASKGYVVEVSGFASAEGGTELNRRLSQRRADQVIRYLVENHNIPLRRIITPFGYGAAQPVADNTTREGREQNRRVEVKVLVNKGLLQDSPRMTTPSSASATPATTTQE